MTYYSPNHDGGASSYFESHHEVSGHDADAGEILMRAVRLINWAMLTDFDAHKNDVAKAVNDAFEQAGINHREVLILDGIEEVEGDLDVFTGAIDYDDEDDGYDVHSQAWAVFLDVWGQI